jgi:hypothetical protein
VARAAIRKATRGETTMNRAVCSTFAQLIALRPPAEMPAPTSPPITAWLDDDGIPKYQVR